MPDAPAPLPGVAPVDPRRDLPAFGDLPVQATFGSGLVRVIAPNPSPLSLDGTNTYVVGEAGSGVALLVDPGPSDPAHRERVAAVLADRDASAAGIVVTHHHEDHSEAARAWADHFGCEVHAPTRAVAGPTGTLVQDGDVLGPVGARLHAVATPGHCADHMAYRLPDGGLLVGDHILGRGTSVVAFPDGDLLAYLDSLDRVLALGPDALHPGHGPEMVDDPSAVVAYYRHHRAFREGQVVEVLAGGAATPGEIVAVLYAAYDRSVWAAAEASTRATLAKLANEGRVELRADTARLLPASERHVAESASLDDEPSDRSTVGKQDVSTAPQEDR